MDILVFGTYDKHRGRLRVILEGLRRSGWKIEECHFPVWGNITDRTQIGPARWPWIALRFLIAYCSLPFGLLFRHRKCSVILVGYFGHLDVFLARIFGFFRPRLIVFDVFISLYDTVVRDRKLVSPNGLAAKLLLLLDKYACKCADVVLFDTNAQARFFKDTFGLYETRWVRAFVSADPDRYVPAGGTQQGPSDVCRVLYYGHYIPLHGIETIIRAASLLRPHVDIEFVLVGEGQMRREAQRLAMELRVDNIRWLGRTPYEEVLKIAENSEIVLGIFGTTEKAQNVIPFKVYEMMAAGRAVITADTPAARELLEDGVHCLLVPPGNPERLASAIERLAKDAELRFHLGCNAHRLFQERLVPEEVVRPIIADIQDEIYVRRNWIAAPRYLLRIHCVKEIVARKPPGRFLEVGCGAGAFLRWLASRGFHGIGTDIAEEASDLINRMLGTYRDLVKFVPAQQLNLRPGELDYLFSFEVLEHIDDDGSLLATWHSCLKTGGVLLLSVPAHQSKWGASDLRAGHYRRYERAGILELLSDHGFEVVTVRSYGFPLANLTDWMRDLLAERTRSEWEGRTKEELTRKSGIDRKVEKKLGFFASDVLLFPFYLIQRWFYETDLGTGYVIEARKS
jgi:glycosyltransferase involved in cell wall biosynthesis/ubiquinone/menaquinone biosynthesis C-methylase UbiE